MMKQNHQKQAPIDPKQKGGRSAQLLRGAVDAAEMLPAETSVEFKKVLDERDGKKVLHAGLSMILQRGRSFGRSLQKSKQTFTAGKRRSKRSRMR